MTETWETKKWNVLEEWAEVTVHMMGFISAVELAEAVENSMD